MRSIFFLKPTAIMLLLTAGQWVLASLVQPDKTDIIDIRLKNNSLLPRQVKLISYEPGTAGNGTQTFFLLPGTSKTLRFKIGTRLYLATQQDINTVMSGQSLRTTPWHVVNEQDSKNPLLLYKKQ